MIAHVPAREAPHPHVDTGPDPCHPNVPDEPHLRTRNIQGNILAGFNKDFQTLLFLEITHGDQFRDWLKELARYVATTEEVLAFNRLFKEIRNRRKADTRTVQATWMNLAISAKGLDALKVHGREEFKDEAFRQGLAKRSAGLGDPKTGEGSPESWVVGSHGNEADVVLIFASDDKDNLAAEVSRIEDSIFSSRTPDGKPFRCGVRILFKQHGATLPPPLTGHEHFGFLDGVSQPGLRGRVSDRPWDVITPHQNPRDPGQGKPGQDLLWPGEFVFDYPGQDPTDVEKPGLNSLESKDGPVAPHWASDGAYFVFRRLRQDVPAFRHFVAEKAHELGMGSDLLGAKLVGRWKSGAPILRSPDHDDRDIGGDDCINNDFEFAPKAEAPPAVTASDPCQCKPNDPAPPDPDGLVCPFAGHIRKSYPRNDTGTLSSDIGEPTTQTHRLLRRGIPFGAPYPIDPPPHHHDSGDRGLLFMAYQTSIVDQFEFVQTQWCNNAEFKDASVNGDLRSGHDLIIGQNSDGPRRLALPFRGEDGRIHRKVIETTKSWVIPTGGGYFFAPSISALHKIAHGHI